VLPSTDYTDWSRPLPQDSRRRAAAVRDTAVQLLSDGQYVAPFADGPARRVDSRVVLLHARCDEQYVAPVVQLARAHASAARRRRPAAAVGRTTAPGAVGTYLYAPGTGTHIPIRTATRTLAVSHSDPDCDSALVGRGRDVPLHFRTGSDPDPVFDVDFDPESDPDTDTAPILNPIRNSPRTTIRTPIRNPIQNPP